MGLLTRFFKKEEQRVSEDAVNKNYVCLTCDPIHSMNDLREGDWNMDKVRESLAMGLTRYAKQSEVEKAIEIGRINR